MTIYLFYSELGDYDDAIIYLAEGLRELNIPFFQIELYGRQQGTAMSFSFDTSQK